MMATTISSSHPATGLSSKTRPRHSARFVLVPFEQAEKEGESPADHRANQCFVTYLRPIETGAYRFVGIVSKYCTW